MRDGTNLVALLRRMEPVLREGEFVFCTTLMDPKECLDLDPVCILREEEGATLVLTRQTADDRALEYSSVFRMITLSVESDLEAVGFLSTITARLATLGIPVNPVSGFHHDHLFVPSSRAVEALNALKNLSATAYATL